MANRETLTSNIRLDEDLLTVTNKWEKTPRSRVEIEREKSGRLPTVMSSCKVEQGGSADLRSVFWAGQCRVWLCYSVQCTLIVGPVCGACVFGNNWLLNVDTSYTCRHILGDPTLVPNSDDERWPTSTNQHCDHHSCSDSHGVSSTACGHDGRQTSHTSPKKAFRHDWPCSQPIAGCHHGKKLSSFWLKIGALPQTSYQKKKTC